NYSASPYHKTLLVRSFLNNTSLKEYKINFQKFPLCVAIDNKNVINNFSHLISEIRNPNSSRFSVNSRRLMDLFFNYQQSNYFNDFEGISEYFLYEGDKSKFKIPKKRKKKVDSNIFEINNNEYFANYRGNVYRVVNDFKKESSIEAKNRYSKVNDFVYDFDTPYFVNKINNMHKVSNNNVSSEKKAARNLDDLTQMKLKLVNAT